MSGFSFLTTSRNPALRIARIPLTFQERSFINARGEYFLLRFLEGESFVVFLFSEKAFIFNHPLCRTLLFGSSRISRGQAMINLERS